jgi:hypothetical protein
MLMQSVWQKKAGDVAFICAWAAMVKHQALWLVNSRRLTFLGHLQRRVRDKLKSKEI